MYSDWNADYTLNEQILKLLMQEMSTQSFAIISAPVDSIDLEFQNWNADLRKRIMSANLTFLPLCARFVDLKAIAFVLFPYDRMKCPVPFEGFVKKVKQLTHFLLLICPPQEQPYEFEPVHGTSVPVLITEPSLISLSAHYFHSAFRYPQKYVSVHLIQQPQTFMGAYARSTGGERCAHPMAWRRFFERTQSK